MSELEKSFKKVMYVGWERSMSPHIEREKKTMKYTVGWDKEAETGWFEMYDEESGGEDYYGSGGLWFDKNELTDYDGVFSLDENVVECIKDWGADTSYVE